LILVALRRTPELPRCLAWIYSLNILGGVAGTISCAFFTIPLFGVQASYLIAGACNLAAALSCLPGWAWRDKAAPVEAVEGDVSRSDGLDRSRLFVAALSGFAVLSVEILWSRLASYFVGNRIFASALLLSCVLTLLAAGSILAGRIMRKRGEDASRAVGGLLALSSLFSVLSTLAVTWWIPRQAVWETRWVDGVGALVILRCLEVFLFLAPVLLPLGTLFPLALGGTRKLNQKTGQVTGLYYAANTVGCVVGSLLTGFLALSYLGAERTAALIGITLAVSAAVALLAGPFRPKRRLALGIGGACAALALAGLTLSLAKPLSFLKEGESLVEVSEDAYGSFQVARTPQGKLRVTNNGTELVFLLGSKETSYVQQMQGHLGMFFRPDATRALVIGSGYGVTAGALTSYPGLQRIDAVEILPLMVKAADLFVPFNHSYHRDPRVRLIVNDGRHFLSNTSDTYDVISINLSDPHLPGSGSLFHREFYQTVKNHLAEGGVMVQHAFGHELPIILSTLRESFPYLAFQRAYGNGYNVVASESPFRLSRASVQALEAIPSVRASLREIGILPPFTIENLLLNSLGPAHLAGLMGAEVATDDRPRLEFAWNGGDGIFQTNE
jgi:predicted membrane-bound spermidine synthase